MTVSQQMFIITFDSIGFCFYSIVLIKKKNTCFVEIAFFSLTFKGISCMPVEDLPKPAPKKPGLFEHSMCHNTDLITRFRLTFKSTNQ